MDAPAGFALDPCELFGDGHFSELLLRHPRDIAYDNATSKIEDEDSSEGVISGRCQTMCTEGVTDHMMPRLREVIVVTSRAVDKVSTSKEMRFKDSTLAQIYPVKSLSLQVEIIHTARESSSSRRKENLL